LTNADKILEGWLNDIKLEAGDLQEDEVKEIVRRRAICEGCPFLSKNAVAAGNYVTMRKDEHCIQCGCPIVKKTASLSSNCGIEIFNASNKDNKMELKWTAYDKNKKHD